MAKKKSNSGEQTYNPYSRSNNYYDQQDMGTYVPGMHENALNDDHEIVRHPQQNDDPVVGFLYSISRKGIGEFWPLHLGTNTIGRSSDMDIVLKEMTVSEHHADILVKQLKKSQNKVIASIRDAGSKTGIIVNDEELDYDMHKCETNDIITIGSCYRLLLLLIDADKYGLTVADNFMPADEIEGGENYSAVGGTDSMYDSSNRNVDTGTVDLNGAGFEGPGGTVDLS